MKFLWADGRQSRRPQLRRADLLGVKNLKIRQKIYKNYIFEVFQNYQKNTQKLHLPFFCFQNYQKYAKITFSIPTAPRSGAICIFCVIFAYFFGNFENSKKVNVIFVYFFGNFEKLQKYDFCIFFCLIL